MKWKNKKIVSKFSWNYRTKKYFSWIPINIGYCTVWLEWYTVKEKYSPYCKKWTITEYVDPSKNLIDLKGK
jgi:hypothetical protein